MSISGLKDKALLVTLNVTKPQLTKTDRKGTHAAESALNAANAGKYVKDMYPRHLIDPILQVEADARQYLYNCTLPWLKGIYLLPTDKYMDFAMQMGKFELMYSQSVTAFLANFSNVMMQAQLNQGDMFDMTAYPDLSTLKAEFTFSLRFMPIADASDFRVKVDKDTLAQLKADTERQMNDVLAESLRDPLRRLYEAVSRIVTQTGKEKGRIYDSLTGNLEELLDVLPSLNLTNDAQLTAILDECRKLTVAPEMLRDEPAVRTRVHAEAMDILARMGGML